MKFIQRFFYLSGIIILPLFSPAQFYNAGQEPASIKWRRISSLNFEVVYPETFEVEAHKVVSMMELAYRKVGYSLNHFPQKVSIILHTGTVKSNAFLGWAPKRIEMYTTPNQNIYSTDWMEQLAVHEYRHMVQLSKIDQEMPQILRILFGDLAAATIAAIHVPFWVLEGDAVTVETALSNSGRGRKPDFLKETKAQIVEKGPYSYSKAYLGSYKDFVPNHYQMGYFMVAGARSLNDNLVWDQIIGTISKNPFKINALNKAIIHQTNMSKKQLYDSVYAFLKNKWTNEIAALPSTETVIVTNENRVYTNYLHPHRATNGKLIALKTALNQTDRFIEIDSLKNEKTLFVPGYLFEESVSMHNNLLIWSEYDFHPRWSHADGTLIRIFDSTDGVKTEFKFKAKLFAPTISPDLKHFAAVEVDNQYQFYLSIFDLETGERLQKIPTKNNRFLMTPSWKNPEELILITLYKGVKNIELYHLKQQEWTHLYAAPNEEISRPQQKDQNLYFISGRTGTDQIFAIDLKSSRTVQLTQAPFGISNYTIGNNTIVYSNYTSNGYQLCETNLKLLVENQEYKPDTPYEFPFVSKISKQENGSIDFNKTNSEISYQSEPFSKLKRAINVHSWAPLYIDGTNQNAGVGVSVMSQNLLSTTEITAGYKYSYEDRAGSYNIDYKYLGWYPRINLSATTGRRNSSYLLVQKTILQPSNQIITDTLKIDYSYKQSSVNLGLDVPFDLTHGKWIRFLQPSINYNIAAYNPDQYAHKSFPDGMLKYVNAGLYFHQILKKSEQDLLPNFGFIARINGATSLPGVKSYGSTWSIIQRFYLPALMPNHGIRTYIGFQEKIKSDFSFSDQIKISRGYLPVANNSMLTLSVDYLMPIASPDFNLGQLIYLKRIDATFFYDQTKLVMPLENLVLEHTQQVRSTGIELTFDTHFLNFIAPIQIGGRTSYLLNSQKLKFEMLLGIQFSF